MREDFIVVKRSPERDPDGSKLRETLQTQVAIDRAHSFRDLMVYALALLSVPMGIFIAWRDVPASPRTLVLAMWVSSLAGLVITGASEWKLSRKRTDLMTELGSRPPSGS